MRRLVTQECWGRYALWSLNDPVVTIQCRGQAHTTPCGRDCASEHQGFPKDPRSWYYRCHYQSELTHCGGQVGTPNSWKEVDTGWWITPWKLGSLFQVPGLSSCSYLRPRACRWGQVPTVRPSQPTAKVPGKDVPNLSECISTWHGDIQGSQSACWDTVPLPSQAHLGHHSQRRQATMIHPIWILYFHLFLNDFCLYWPIILYWLSLSLEHCRFHHVNFWVSLFFANLSSDGIILHK